MSDKEPRHITIFGATGSIGQNTLRVIKDMPETYQITALTAGENVEKLAKDAIAYRAQLAVIANPKKYKELKTALSGTNIAVAAGAQGLIEAADLRADFYMSAIVGIAGLAPGLAALKHGTTMALANKESLVAGGAYFMQIAAQKKTTVIPVDSEHTGVFQALMGQERSAVRRVILTASGGAFGHLSKEELQDVTLEQAVKHPVWSMGKRITIDSASLFNKALEMIEAREFFDLNPKQIEVLIHPQAIIHALVGFNDGALMAHLGVSDMRHAIGFALNWPHRRALGLKELDLAAIGQLTFLPPDPVKFPALRLAEIAMELQGLAGAVLNGAKEQALDAFIAGQIHFTDMAGLVETAMERFSVECGFNSTDISFESITQADLMARHYVKSYIPKLETKR